MLNGEMLFVDSGDGALLRDESCGRTICLWHGDEPATARRPLPDRWRCCSKRPRGDWRRTPPAQNDAKVVLADGGSRSREGLGEPMSAYGTHKLFPFGLTTDTTAVAGSDLGAGESQRVVRETSTPLESSASAYDGGRSSDGLPIWNGRAWVSGGAPTTRTHRPSWTFVVRHATSVARIGEGVIRGMASHREPCATTGMLTRAFLPHSALTCGRTYQLQIQRHLKKRLSCFLCLR